MIGQLFSHRVTGELVVVTESTETHIGWVPAGGGERSGGNLLAGAFPIYFEQAAGPIISRNTRAFRSNSVTDYRSAPTGEYLGA